MTYQTVEVVSEPTWEDVELSTLLGLDTQTVHSRQIRDYSDQNPATWYDDDDDSDGTAWPEPDQQQWFQSVLWIRIRFQELCGSGSVPVILKIRIK